MIRRMARLLVIGVLLAAWGGCGGPEAPPPTDPPQEGEKLQKPTAPPRVSPD